MGGKVMNKNLQPTLTNFYLLSKKFAIAFVLLGFFLFVQPVFSQHLSFLEFHQDGAGGVDGLDAARSVTVSPDGNHVYVAGKDDDAVAVFSRNVTTGALTFVEFQQDGAGGVDGLDYAISVTVSPDNNNVYAAGLGDNAVAVFGVSAGSPEIDVQRPAGTSIPDGGTDDMGNQTIGAVNVVYTIDNSASTAQLDILSVTALNMVNCSGFSVVSTLPMNIPAAATSVLQVSFNIDGVGAFSFDMAIENNDQDETPYDIHVLGIGLAPTSVELSSFNAEVGQDGILTNWTTETEPNNAGFNIYRATEENGDYSKVNATLIPALGDATSGASYSYVDKPEQAGNYYYKLQSVSLNGSVSFHGPVFAGLTSVDMQKLSASDNYTLSQNYPNPFNPETTIEFGIPTPGFVEISIYDINGKLIRTLVSGQRSAGNHIVKWNASDEAGNRLTSGVYYYQVKVGDFQQTHKMILMK